MRLTGQFVFSIEVRQKQYVIDVNYKPEYDCQTFSKYFANSMSYVMYNCRVVDTKTTGHNVKL